VEKRDDGEVSVLLRDQVGSVVADHGTQSVPYLVQTLPFRWLTLGKANEPAVTVSTSARSTTKERGHTLAPVVGWLDVIMTSVVIRSSSA